MEQNRREALINELEIKAVRSSGPGGQHVNKVSTKVELRFNIQNSRILLNNEKFLINLKLSNRISAEGELIITDQSSRSQLKNKDFAISRFILLIEQALKQPKTRVATKPTKQSKRKRIDNKKKLSMKKQLRKKWED